MPDPLMTEMTPGFTIVRLRAGYDREQVDGFLREAQEEINRLEEENSGLRHRLETNPADSSRVAGPAAGPVAAPVAVDPLDGPRAVLAQTEREHAGFLADARAERVRILGEAGRTATEMVQNAQRQRRETLEALEGQKKQLEDTVKALQVFERGHYTHLKSLMSEGLGKLDTDEVA